MEQMLGRVPVMLVTILAAAAAYFLRLSQLGSMYDETGRVVAGAGFGPLTWLCAAMVLVFALYAWFLRPRKKHAALSSRGPGVLACTLAGALGLLLGCVAMIRALEQSYDLLLAAGGMVTALCWVVTALDRWRARRLPAMLFMVPALFYAVRLIFDFRNWSRDPAILDYCFDLLALICIMCATFHLGGFCFDQGRRRVTVFFCCCGILFGAAAIAGGRMREIAMTGGAMLWLAANLWTLLQPTRSRRGGGEEGE